jgi:hypothetical protein
MRLLFINREFLGRVLCPLAEGEISELSMKCLCADNTPKGEGGCYAFDIDLCFSADLGCATMGSMESARLVEGEYAQRKNGLPLARS